VSAQGQPAPPVNENEHSILVAIGHEDPATFDEIASVMIDMNESALRTLLWTMQQRALIGGGENGGTPRKFGWTLTERGARAMR
jgi:hypothetical protein